jgi:HlyD family secretion protein
MSWVRRGRSRGKILGPQPETNEAANEQPIAWIGRQDADKSSDNIVSEPIHGGWSAGRWTFVGLGVLLAAAAIGAAIYFGTNRGTASSTQEGSTPLVSASAPGVSAITTTVAFTGTINARYDMPLGTEGETGRVSAIYVEAGDHVKAGQLLAQVNESVLKPQVDRLAASLEEAKANADLATAEYGRARGVEAAGASRCRGDGRRAGESCGCAAGRISGAT